MMAAAAIISGCTERITFKAGVSDIYPDTSYLLTVETVDSLRNTVVTACCDTIPGISVTIRWEKDGNDLVAKATVRNDTPE